MREGWDSRQRWSTLSRLSASASVRSPLRSSLVAIAPFCEGCTMAIFACEAFCTSEPITINLARTICFLLCSLQIRKLWHGSLKKRNSCHIFRKNTINLCGTRIWHKSGVQQLCILVCRTWKKLVKLAWIVNVLDIYAAELQAMAVKPQLKETLKHYPKESQTQETQRCKTHVNL